MTLRTDLEQSLEQETEREEAALLHAVTYALAERYIERGKARVTGSDYACVEDMPNSYMRDFRDDARAAVLAYRQHQ